MYYLKKSYLKRLAFVCGALLLVACNNGGSSSSSSSVPGSLAFTPDETVDLRLISGTSGEYVAILSLENSSGVSGEAVSLSIDSSVASLSTDTCYLSSGSVQSSECRITISAVAAGSTTLTASASGYQNATLPVVVTSSSSPNYGALDVRNADGQYVTGPVALTYAPDGGVLTVEAELLGSSGITTGTSIGFTVPAGATATPASCSVTTQTPTCTSRVSGLPATGTSVITVGATTSQGSHTYTSVQVNATAQAPSPTTKNGTIVIQSQHSASAGIPNGMKAPLFVGMQDLGRDDVVTVNLSIPNWTYSSPLSLYQFNIGDNQTLYVYGATNAAGVTTSGVSGGSVINSCVFTISGGSVSTQGSGSECGYGLASLANSGAVTISATYSSTHGYTYDISSLVASARANLVGDAVRQVNFTNSSSDTIYVAATSGAASAYLGPNVMAGNPTTLPNGQVQLSASSFCSPQGANSSQHYGNACPIGTSCRQGGANPSSTSIDPRGGTPYYCYWDAQKPVASGQAASADVNTLSANYQLASTDTAAIYISKYSLAPAAKTSTTSYAPMIWSGNFFARQGCNSSTGLCTNGTCGTGGLACAPGTGASPGVNTLAEVTFQTSPAYTDYYDVSIINGVNYQAQFGPTTTVSSLKTDTSTGYTCGTAGSTSAQSGTTFALKAATWSMAPTGSSSFPQSGGASFTSDKAKSYYRIVTNPVASCNSDGSCSTGVCGWSGFDSVTAGSATYTQQCGTHLTWITANSLWGQNQVITGPTPNTLSLFGFSTATPSSGWTATGGSQSVGNYQLCTNSIFSAYQSAGDVNPLLACGAASWWNGALNVITGVTLTGGWTYTNITGSNTATPTQAATYSSSNWQNWVLPTISWLKTACPTCYTFPYDDMSSTFQCSAKSSGTNINYGLTFSNTN